MAGDCTRQIPRRGFLLSLAATILMMAAASAPSLFYPQIAERLELVPVATTFVFAVYTFTLLAALLYLGPLSDYIGRRPVVTAGSLALALSLAMFWFAGGLATLLVARALQGLAAGLLIPALSAMMIDFEPPSHPNIAALWNTIGPMIGLGTGALGAALLLDLTPEPTAAVFGLLVLAFLIVAATVWITPELVPKTRLRRGDLRPRFTVPPHLRRMFTAGVPAIIAGWATNGLFLALGAGLVGSELGGSTHTHAGIVIFALAISGVTASSVLQRRSARTISLYATSALAFGTAVSIGALALGSYPAYVASVAIVGSGFGTAFLGVLRTLMPHTASSERAAVMAVIYTVAYLAFGVPTIVAGLLVPVLTLSGTMTILGAIIIALSLAATVLRLRIPQAVAGPAETDDLPEPPTDSHRRSAPDREEQP
ncbi:MULTISPECIES: MFS transporter [Micrococcales]|uniref:Predicted arabinose efflux permease, MFS family n=2 Tax=Micrococcales TaxID=85006 RepID=A0A1W2BPN6_9MICO|nr:MULTISPECIES: MFS transporter [Micrococcales]MCW4600207.1 MFS transporter [Janibacter hoylei]SMC74592.1 Predicted arabinose efflux permease, MFS family [Janibacter indicus]HRY10556.1 MFS transporter [Candidatus Nanopelagicales bacterium]